jgi:hypothetical protein
MRRHTSVLEATRMAIESASAGLCAMDKRPANMPMTARAHVWLDRAGAMSERVGRGSLTGRWKPRPGSCPNIRGGITIERDLPANTRLWLTGWTKTIQGARSCLSLWRLQTKMGGRANVDETFNRPRR